jgi:hypothetical protein
MKERRRGERHPIAALRFRCGIVHDLKHVGQRRAVRDGQRLENFTRPPIPRALPSPGTFTRSATRHLISYDCFSNAEFS